MGECLTKECIEEYLEKLAHEIEQFMEQPITSRSTDAIDSMVGCYTRIKALSEKVESIYDEAFTKEDAEYWNANMDNEDGTHGGHWSIGETNGVDKPMNVPDYVWNVVMNMMYSDYYQVANRFGVNTPRFYADLSRAFIDDKDANENKVNDYYVYIVK